MDRLTVTGVAVGTPRYMAPEQGYGGAADTRSDQYSFSVAALEALTGVHPVVGDRGPAPPVGQPGARVLAVLRRGMASRPADRWPSMTALLVELERPSPRRLWIGAGLAVAVSAAAVVVVRRMSDATAAACRLEADVWNEVVGEPDGRSIRAAFAATGAPRAALAADGALRLLARYAGDHGAMARSSCEATRIKGTQPPAHYALRADCLRRHRRTLRALADELGRPDKTIVGRAVEAAQALPPVAECADADAIDAREPGDARLRPAVAALRAELDQLDVLDAVGRLWVVVVRGHAAVALARLVGFAPVVADALVRLGTTYNRLDQFALSRELLEDGLYVAQSSGNDPALVRAAILLSRVAWYAEHKMDQARSWARLATATLARLGPGSEGELLGARLELRLSDLDRVEGRYRLAEEHARRAIDVYARLQPDSRALHAGRLSLASALEEEGRLDESAVVYRQALDSAAQLVLGGDDVSRIYGGLGIVAARQGRPEEAREHYLKAIERATEATGPSSTLVAGYLNNLANVNRSAGRLEEALDGYRRARAIIAARVGERSTQISGYLRNEGVTLAALGRRAEARATLDEALVLAEKEVPQGLELADSLLQLALLDIDEGDLAAAAPLARRALALTEAIDRESWKTSEALSVLATATEESGAASLPLFERALALMERMQGPSSPEVARVRGEMGVAQRRAGRREEARATLEKAFAMAPDALTPRALAALGHLVAEAGERERAAQLLRQARDGFAMKMRR